MIRIDRPGMLASIQDHGRRGLRHLGIPWAGALVPQWMALANALVGNARGHAVIECFEGGFSAEIIDSAVRIAIVGDARLCVTGGEQTVELACWRSHVVAAGSRIDIRSTGRWRLAVLAVEALCIEPQYGSCATYARARLGGLDGGPLKAGDQLPTASKQAPDSSADRMERGCPPLEPDSDDTIELHCVPGPQRDAFTAAALSAFLASAWRVTGECDRMGTRLAGEAIEHRNPVSREIVSDAIVPGSVQVPGNGQPIVLQADAHTAGGYPKIATVTTPDLGWLALYRPGSTVQFSSLSSSEAIVLTRHTDRQLHTHLNDLYDINEARLDSAALLNCNLIDGVTDGS